MHNNLDGLLASDKVVISRIGVDGYLFTTIGELASFISTGGQINYDNIVIKAGFTETTPFSVSNFTSEGNVKNGVTIPIGSYDHVLGLWVPNSLSIRFIIVDDSITTIVNTLNELDIEDLTINGVAGKVYSGTLIIGENPSRIYVLV